MYRCMYNKIDYERRQTVSLHQVYYFLIGISLNITIKVNDIIKKMSSSNTKYNAFNYTCSVW